MVIDKRIISMAPPKRPESETRESMGKKDHQEARIQNKGINGEKRNSHCKCCQKLQQNLHRIANVQRATIENTVPFDNVWHPQ